MRVHADARNGKRPGVTTTLSLKKQRDFDDLDGHGVRRGNFLFRRKP